ncbi:MAG: cytochrome c biogenesis protein CcdA [Pyrobaculum sp.]
MRSLLVALLASVLALSLTIGSLNFVDVKSAQDLQNALGEGPVLIFIHQVNCPGCAYMKQHVFPEKAVADALKGVRLISVDLGEYPLTSLDVVANGTVYVYAGTLYAQRAYGEQKIPIAGTPTVIMGFAKGGKLYVTAVIIGALEADRFVEITKLAYAQQSSAANAKVLEGVAVPLQLATAFAAGAASVFSPCVLPVVTIAATTYLAKRRLGIVLLGMVLSFSALAVAATAATALAGELARTVLYVLGGVVLVGLGLVLAVERLNKAFVLWASRLQTSAYKISKKATGGVGDLLLGASLGAVWMPCIAPFLGAVVVANILASALSGNYLAVFAATVSYASGLAAVIYVFFYVVRRSSKHVSKSNKWATLGRRIELVVGILSIILGALFIGEALGLRTVSLLF